MGVWDYGLLDNDPAQDIKELWDEMINGLLRYTPEDVTKICMDRWGDAVNYGDSITNSEILALAVLYLNNNFELPKKLRKITIDAINRELVSEELSEWKEPGKRKEALLHLLKETGGKVNPPRKTLLKKDSALYYKDLKIAREDLLSIIDDANGKPWNVYCVVKRLEEQNLNIPPFLATLDRYLKHRVWEKDSQINDQAIAERLMMITTFLGMWLKLPKHEIERLLEKCNIFE